jgi:hypothetical protein
MNFIAFELAVVQIAGIEVGGVTHPLPVGETDNPPFALD